MGSKTAKTLVCALGVLLASAAPAFAAAAQADPLNSGDTAWMLTSSALVLMMTIPGLALFYGGMVRKKNVLATLAQSFGATCVVTVLWMIIGYSIAFTPNASDSPTRFIGGVRLSVCSAPMGLKSDRARSRGTIPESVYMFFQMTFAIITPALIAGALADRMKFSAFMWFMSLWLLVGLLPDRALGVGRRLARHHGRARLCRRHGRASERGHRRRSSRAWCSASARASAPRTWRRTTSCSASSALRCCGSAGSASTRAPR